MMARLLGCTVAALALSLPLAASDPVGCYAIIDRVDFEPTQGLPERVRFWGAFELSHGFGGEVIPYDPPARGSMYFSLEKGSEMASRTEWSDLAKLAGTGQCVAFGNRYDRPKPQIRSGFGSALPPDTYRARCLTKLRSDTAYPPIQDLLTLPAPSVPPDGSTAVQPGKITLVTTNILEPTRTKASYVFEIEDSSGAKEVSGPISPGEGQTSWSPGLQIAPGERYTWRVRAVDGDWSGPVATAEFRLVFLRGDANGDTQVDISDAVAVLEFLFAARAAPQPREAGDADGSGAIDISDAVYLLNFLFLGGKQPPLPFPEPGLKTSD